MNGCNAGMLSEIHTKLKDCFVHDMNVYHKRLLILKQSYHFAAEFERVL